MPFPACRPLTFIMTGFGWLLLASLLGLALLIGLVRGTPLPPGLKLVHVHGALVGGVAQIIMGAMLTFVSTLLMTGRDRRDSHPVLFAAMNGGALALVLGFGFRNYQVVAAAGSVVFAAFFWVAQDTWRQARRSVNRPPLNVWYYALALAALAGGLALGIGMAAQLIQPAWTGSARLVHLHLNLMGFVTVTIIGTMHNLLPTVLQQPLHSPRLAKLVFFLLPISIALLIGGFALSSLSIEFIGGTVLALGLCLYAFNLFATWRASSHPGSAASDHLLTATFFLVLAVFMGLLVAANYLGEHPFLPFGTLHLVAYTHTALTGFVMQTIFGALSHLVPVTLAVHRIASNKKRGLYLERLTGIMNRWRIVQVAGLSMGTLGLGLVASLTWTVPLGSAAVHTAVWVTFGLFLISLTLFSVKLAWVFSSQPTKDTA